MKLDEPFMRLVLEGWLAEHYGFVLEDNPYNTAQLPVEKLPEDIRGTVPVKASCLQRNGMPSWELLRELRIWAASQTGCMYGNYPHC